MTTLTELLARWDSGDGKPFKGKLIDWDAYQDDSDNLGCMCAGGQVLHVIGGWEPDRIKDTQQTEADKQVAALLNISRAHAVLLRNVNDNADGAPSIVLTDPGKVLGDQWSKLLDFWWHMDQMDAKGWGDVAASYAARYAARDAASYAARVAASYAASYAARYAARVAASYAARVAASVAARDAASVAASVAARDAASVAASVAASEIQGAHIFIAAKRPFYFLPFFGFADPDAIPARPADYGKVL